MMIGLNLFRDIILEANQTYLGKAKVSSQIKILHFKIKKRKEIRLSLKRDNQFINKTNNLKMFPLNNQS